uniref:F-box domain-containing protein n=1 Tax=Heterorhabditis bacteriophora TaxID=37862 RepID=A0A1I7XNG6_HETBA
MSLIPLTVYDNLRRVCCSVFASSSRVDHTAIADRLVAGASLVDVLRWRRVSRAFRDAAVNRITQYTNIHVRVYDGLCKLYMRRTENMENEDLYWHPSSCLLLSEMNSHTLGIAVDSKPTWKDIKSLLSLLDIFRPTAEQVHMDSPIIEILVKEVIMNN